MTETEQRHLARDSMFVLADLRLDGSENLHRIKVRNLSSGGMMGEGQVPVQRGALLWVDIRNIGWVEGSVAWVQGNRFGIAFREEINPNVVRAPAAVPVHQPPRHVRIDDTGSSSTGVVRKV